MGNEYSVSDNPTDSSPADGNSIKEVMLHLHAVHNIQHNATESYYGYASDDIPDSPEVVVTSEHPARLFAGLDTQLTLRILLHERGAPSARDRSIGGLVIRIRDMLELCGPGIYQTWFLLDEAVSNRGGSYRSGEKLRSALRGVTQHVHAPRVCLSLLEANADPESLLNDRVAYYCPLLVSHTQLVHMTGAYLDFADIAELNDESSRRQSTASLRQSTASLPPEPNLQRELGRLQQQRLQEEEVAQLQTELNQLIVEANKRIETGKESIVQLKAQLRQLQETDIPELQRARTALQFRSAEVQRRSSELREQAEARGMKDEKPVEDEIGDLLKQVQVLKDQKAALLKMVQGVYGGNSPDASPAPEAAMPHIGSSAMGPATGNGVGIPRLLPSASDLLNGHR